ncbi:MAG: hypothetical protein FJ038_02370 [Chloroflexi bacterium]|nr:hypothetical protein [Chloroflexota bacterium]
MPSPTTTAGPADTPRPTPHPTPAPTPPPTPAPTPTPLTGQTRVHRVAPTSYVEARIRGDSRLEALPDGSIRVVSTRASNADQYVEWWVDESVIMPPGSQAARVVTVVCGGGSGDWWEVYGPYGSDEFEFEVTGPGSDGCWYFNESGRHTDFRVEIWLSRNAEMTISRIEFHVTFA